MAKVKIWRYSLPPIDGEGWGIFLLDSTGMFAAVTDYGNYAYKWTHHDCKDFREFFANVEKRSENDYFIKKLFEGRRREYRGDMTMKAIREHILYYRRAGTYSKEFARDEWDLLRTHEDEMDHEVGFGRYYDDTKLPDSAEFIRYDYPADLKAFGSKLLPRLAAVLQEELQREAV